MTDPCVFVRLLVCLLVCCVVVLLCCLVCSQRTAIVH